MTVQSENETALVAGLLFDPRAIDAALEERVRVEDFTRPDLHAVYAALLSMHERGDPITAVTVTNELDRAGRLDIAGGAVAVSRLEGAVPSSAHVRTVAREVRSRAQLRELAAAAREVITDCELGYEAPGEVIAAAERRVLSVARDDGRKSRGIKDLLKTVTEDLEQAYKRKSVLTGVSTGLEDVDQLTSGWTAGDLIIIAARPSMGKTAFTLNVAAHAAIRCKTPTAFFSLEMGPESLTQRILGAEAGIDIQALRRGFIKPGDWARLAETNSELGEAPLFIEDCPGISIPEMRSRVRRLVAREKVGLIVVDYLQLMSGPPSLKSNPTASTTEISKGLKNIAREFNVPVIALSQLNRGVEARTDKRPLMSDLRESGAIEQDADLIGFLYREEYYLKEKTPDDLRGVAEFIVAKHRNGPVGSVDLTFKASTTRFSSRARRQDYV